MQFDELCALVGALRSRVAELEAKEQARAEREAKTVVVGGSGRPVSVADRNRLS